jgi:hypothetical protein
VSGGIWREVFSDRRRQVLCMTIVGPSGISEFISEKCEAVLARDTQSVSRVKTIFFYEIK